MLARGVGATPAAREGSSPFVEAAPTSTVDASLAPVRDRHPPVLGCHVQHLREHRDRLVDRPIRQRPLDDVFALVAPGLDVGGLVHLRCAVPVDLGDYSPSPITRATRPWSPILEDATTRTDDLESQLADSGSRIDDLESRADELESTQASIWTASPTRTGCSTIFTSARVRGPTLASQAPSTCPIGHTDASCA